MKKFLILLSMLFCFTAFAQTETLNWYIGDDVYATTTCESGGNVLLPTTPTKRGYTFKGWAGYIPIEYLESTGMQAIDTGVIITGTNTDINIVMSVVSVASQKGNVPFFFGAGSPWVASFAINPPRYQYNLYNYGYYGSNYTLNEKHSYRFVLSPNSAQYYVDGILYANHSNLTTVNGDDKIYLFARNYDGDIGYFSYMKLYRFSISMDNSLVRDFIPVLDGNGTPCMYDKVTEQFFYNQGTGQFIAGPIVGSGE